MVTQVKVWASSDNAKNLKAMALLKKLGDIKIQCFTSVSSLENLVDLPFIEDEEGLRCFGIEDIEWFVNYKLRERDLIKKNGVLGAV